MDAVWSFRLMLTMAIGVIIFGDILGYGTDKRDRGTAAADKDEIAHTAAHTGTDRHSDPLKRSNQNVLRSNALETNAVATSPADGQNGALRNGDTKMSTVKLSDALRDACLPKMLCEMAARPIESLNDREKDLLSLIRTTTMSLAMAMTPTKWHFAAHMGQLLRYGDARGCRELWPNCPFSSQKLSRLSSKVTLK